MYSTFVVDQEDADYELHVGGYSGNATDAMGYLDHSRFSTKDRPNDDLFGLCLQLNAGFWYRSCTSTTINGKQPLMIWNYLPSGSLISSSRVHLRCR